MESVEFNRLLSEFQQLGVGIIGTSVDPLEKLKRFREKYELGFPLLTDTERTLGKAYGTLKKPGGSHERDTFIIAKDGTVVAAYQKVSAKGHAAVVLAETRRLRDEARI